MWAPVIFTVAWAVLLGCENQNLLERLFYYHVDLIKDMPLQVDNSFKIVQFADLHFGENQTKDSITKALMRDILASEMPDFIVFSGDQITGYAVESDGKRLLIWADILSIAEEFQIPFATIFGNHDDQPYHMDFLKLNRLAHVIMVLAISVLLLIRSQKIMTRFMFIPTALILSSIVMTAPSRIIRSSILEYESSKFANLSYSTQSSSSIHGSSNYRIILQAPNASAVMYFLDSGGGRIQEMIHSDQIDWLKNLNYSLFPAIAFVHIPPAGFTGLFETNRCNGPPPKEQVSFCAGSSGLTEALEQVGTRAIFVGHDHGNSWCCMRGQQLLCYGRHSGYGGYDFENSTRGARIIELEFVNQTSFTITTRIRNYDCLPYC